LANSRISISFSWKSKLIKKSFTFPES
jgi:hypothetical protein